MVAAIGLALPAYESRVGRMETRLDEFAPAWQFREVHTIRIAAPPAVVFEAIKRLRADEIFLFRTLTWIRRGGRQAPRSILNPGDATPLLDVATSTGFVSLAVDEPRELVIGAMVVGSARPASPAHARRVSAAATAGNCTGDDELPRIARWPTRFDCLDRDARPYQRRPFTPAVCRATGGSSTPVARLSAACGFEPSSAVRRRELNFPRAVQSARRLVHGSTRVARRAGM